MVALLDKDNLGQAKSFSSELGGVTETDAIQTQLYIWTPEWREESEAKETGKRGRKVLFRRRCFV